MSNKTKFSRYKLAQCTREALLLSGLSWAFLHYLTGMNGIEAVLFAPLAAATAALAMHLFAYTFCLLMRGIDRLADTLHIRRSPLA